MRKVLIALVCVSVVAALYAVLIGLRYRVDASRLAHQRLWVGSALPYGDYSALQEVADLPSHYSEAERATIKALLQELIDSSGPRFFQGSYPPSYERWPKSRHSRWLAFLYRATWWKEPVGRAGAPILGRREPPELWNHERVKAEARSALRALQQSEADGR